MTLCVDFGQMCNIFLLFITYNRLQPKSDISTLQLELRSNNALVFTSITATSEGSSDELETFCPPGHELDDQGVCQTCSENTYGTDGTSCQSCPAESTSLAGSDELTDCACNEDHYREGGKCESCPGGGTSSAGSTAVTDCQCPVNKYMDEKNCVSCPGSGTSDKGSTSITQCKCPADHYMQDKTCQECAGGKKSPSGSTSPDACKESEDNLTPG